MEGRSFLAGLAGVLIAASAAVAGDLPDPLITPGALNPGVTQANLAETVCIPGYTATIRPPEQYTYQMKRAQLKAYGYFRVRLRDFEEDHLVPLGLGGHPTDPRNLWPQRWDGAWGAKKKDVLERYLHKQVCRGNIPLAEAQQAMATNWIEAYRRYITPAAEANLTPFEKGER